MLGLGSSSPVINFFSENIIKAKSHTHARASVPRDDSPPCRRAHIHSVRPSDFVRARVGCHDRVSEFWSFTRFTSVKTHNPHNTQVIGCT